VIYFVRDTATGRVKIGYSADPWSRMVKMQADCPGELVLVGIIDGDRAVEADVHRRFGAHRERGEWFRAEGELAAFLVDLAQAARRIGVMGRRTALIQRLAHATGASHNTAAAWVARGRIPTGYWSKIADAGIAQLEDLAQAMCIRNGRRSRPLAALLERAA
jgi:hypothetical protein